MFTFLENGLNLLMPMFPNKNSKQNFLKICFPEQQKGVQKTIICFIKIQLENMKIFCIICNFSKCDGFTVL